MSKAESGSKNILLTTNLISLLILKLFELKEGKKRTISNNNTISLSCYEELCLIRLRLERYFSHHQAT